MRQTALVAGMIAFCLVTAVAMFAAVIVMQPPPIAASTGADARRGTVATVAGDVSLPVARARYRVRGRRAWNRDADAHGQREA